MISFSVCLETKSGKKTDSVDVTVAGTIVLRILDHGIQQAYFRFNAESPATSGREGQARTQRKIERSILGFPVEGIRRIRVDIIFVRCPGIREHRAETQDKTIFKMAASAYSEIQIRKTVEIRTDGPDGKNAFPIKLPTQFGHHGPTFGAVNIQAIGQASGQVAGADQLKIISAIGVCAHADGEVVLYMRWPCREMKSKSGG